MTLQKIDTTTGEILPPAFSFADVHDMAAAIVRGGLFPQFKTPEQALSLMLLCQAKGLHPMVAVERYDVIQGRPAMKTSFLLAEFRARGGRVQWHDGPTDERVGGVFIAASGDTMDVVWTKERAIKAKLWSKPGAWQEYPQQMLRARCIGEAIRALAPECLHGLYTTDEVADMPPLPPPINVTPPPPQRRPLLSAPKDAEASAPTYERMAAKNDAMMEARTAFDAMAAKMGEIITSGHARGELANRVLGRAPDSREAYTVADWHKATALLPAFLTSARVAEMPVVDDGEEEDTSEPLGIDALPTAAATAPAPADAAIDDDPLDDPFTLVDATPNYAQSELAATGRKGQRR